MNLLAQFFHKNRLPYVSLCTSLATLAMVASAPAQDAAKKAQAPAATIVNSGWNVQCNTVNSDLVCLALMDVTYVKNKNRFIRIAIQPSNDGKKNLTLQLPLGLSLPDGAQLTVDDKEPANVVIQTCTQQGCFARTEFTDGMSKEFKAGQKLTVALKSNQQRKINVELPLTGFTKAVDKLQ